MRRSKLSERLYRPTQHILASWVHGFGLTFFISQEDHPKDSETSIEAMSRVLSEVYLESSRSLPLTLHIQHDGTPREAKNQFFLQIPHVAGSTWGVPTSLHQFLTSRTFTRRPGSDI